VGVGARSSAAVQACDFRKRGEAVLAVERGPDRAAHQSAAGKRDEDGCGKPADRYAPAVDRLFDIAVEAERRLVA
jgi:hypothetical protein